MREYDRRLIEYRVNAFRESKYKPDEIILYFDMDNTLALFSPFGEVEKSMRAAYSKGFYRELLCFPEAPPVLENLQRIGFNVKILSSCIDSPYCIPEKRSWVNYHLPFIDNKDILLLPVGENKTNMIVEPKKSILIDDYCNNLIDMYQAGGIGVKKTFSGKERPLPQINNLVDIFSVLNDLNCL